ncbi:hypothetical protein HCU74_12350 [Spongiibacter sp. KMU-166]|uniref:DUF4124 domain-containing protein n=1 Tax=Spongiibacter thalassae TaxID=2721624 RepID=A0ABX1GG62_9GAMM|nr:hypothetical protein [Spongiibacter thalassae]NKI18197.1 hypothetical protein [Spongiibacter thalassae]
MQPLRSLKWITLAALLLAFAGTAVAEKVFYRYVDSEGKIAIVDRLTPEIVPRGYDIIRANGTVVDTIAPRLSDDERRVWRQEQAVAKARAEAEAKMRAWDESLLLRYSDVADIDVAKERALRDIQVRISILKSNLTAIKQQVLNNQAEAAELERRGQQVPESLVTTLSDLRREVSGTEAQIVSRTQELDEVAEAYERDRARFSQLQESVLKRRNYHRNDEADE